MKVFVRLVPVMMLAAMVAGCAGWCPFKKGAEKVALFNGKDFDGWSFTMRPPRDTPNAVPNPMDTWSVKDGVIACTGRPTGYMRTNEMYSNYKLTVEWRYTGEPGNSGVIVHATGPDKVWPATIELQTANNSAGDIWLQGGASVDGYSGVGGGDQRNVKKKGEKNEKPVGEWNRLEAICVDDTVRLIVNGVEQNYVTGASASEGYIGLQSEGAPVEYRNIELIKLPETKKK